MVSVKWLCSQFERLPPTRKANCPIHLQLEIDQHKQRKLNIITGLFFFQLQRVAAIFKLQLLYVAELQFKKKKSTKLCLQDFSRKLKINVQNLFFNSCMCAGRGSSGLTQALCSPDDWNFKDQIVYVGVSITVCGFTVHVSMPVRLRCRGTLIVYSLAG